MNPIPTQPIAPSVQGMSITVSSKRLRNYSAIERARIRILAGWFLRIGDYEIKYVLAYHLFEASEHTTWIRERLKEMRGGNPNASIRPDLAQFLEKTLHAPSDTEFLRGQYGVLTSALLTAIQNDVTKMDTSANANELRLLNRIKGDLSEQVAWFKSLDLNSEDSDWSSHIHSTLNSIGGIHGDEDRTPSPPSYSLPHFERPSTLHFDSRIQIGELKSYKERAQLDREQATIEQFKVFFNEFYAAALLASILFDAAENDYPWEFFADFSRHFWDEARHSEFGAIRLRELGVEPDRVNLVLYEESQNLPVLHRVTYLTRGLEAYFMPRKPVRMKEYEENGDFRSQLFADQDWSDEINHVRYGSRWINFLLENDSREIEDIMDEVKQHLSEVRKVDVQTIEAPY